MNMDQDSQESDIIAVSKQDLALEQYFDSMLNYFTTTNALNKSTFPSFKRTLLDAIKKYEKIFDGVSTSFLSDVEKTADPKAVEVFDAENNNQNALNLLDDTSVTQMNTDDDNDTNTFSSSINEENNAENTLINETSTDPNQGPNVIPIQSECENNEGALDVALALPSVQVEEVDVQMLAVTTEGATEPVIADTAVEDALQASQEIIEEGEELEEGELESNASDENEAKETKFQIMSKSVECVVKLLRDETKAEIVDEKYMRDTLNLHTSDDIIGFVESAIGEYLLNEKFVLSITDLVIHSPHKNRLTVELANQLWKESFKKYIDLKEDVPAALALNSSTEPASFFDDSEMGVQKIKQIRDQERRIACTKLMCQLYIHSYVEMEIFVTYVYTLLRQASNQNILYCLCELLEMTGKMLETFLENRDNFLVLNEKNTKFLGSQFMNLVFGQMNIKSKMTDLHESVRWKVNELIYWRNNDWKEKDKFGNTNYSIYQVPSTSRRIVLQSPPAGPSVSVVTPTLQLPPVHSESAIQPEFPTNEVTVTMHPSFQSFQELVPNKSTNFGRQGNKNRRGKGNNARNNRKIQFDPKYGYQTQRNNDAFIQSQQDDRRTQTAQQNPKRRRPNKNNKKLSVLQNQRKRPNKRQNLMNEAQRNIVSESANRQENSLMKINKNLTAELKRTQKQLMKARLSNASSNPI